MDTKLYCTCRSPDDGTWMINCEACDEWFHGRCINLLESDGYKIDVFICSTCTEAGRGMKLTSPLTDTVGSTSYKPERPKRTRPQTPKPVSLFSPTKKQKTSHREPIKSALFTSLKQGLEADLRRDVRYCCLTTHHFSLNLQC